MNNEKNFYDILRSKFNEKEEPFDEANWKSMRKMIDDSRADKKRTMWIAASLLFLLMSGGTFALIEWKTGGGKQNTVASSIQNNAINNSATPLAESGKQSTTSANPVEGNNTKTAITNNNNGVNNSTTQTAVKTNQNPSDGNNVIATTNTNQLVKSVKKHGHSSKSGNQKIASNNEVALMNKQLAAIEKDTKVENTISSKDEPANLSTANKEQINTTVLQVSKANPSTAKTTTAATASATKAHIADSIASEKLPQRFSDEPRIFNGEKQMISIDIGGSYSGGWNYGGIIQGSGFNYLFGVGYARYLKSKLFVKAGIQFNEFGNMSTFSYNYQTTPSTHIVNDSVVTTKRLYYLTIPLQVEWFYHRNWSFSLGGTFSYLLGSKGSATTYQQIDNNPPVNIQNYSQNIQLNGYSKFTSSAYFMFGYTFNRHFSLRIGYYRDLIPLENKSFFGENASAVSQGFKSIFSYTL